MEDGKIEIVCGTNKLHTLRAGYLVGCDGARSRVRDFITNATYANPVDIQLNFPMLSQFRIYIFLPCLLTGAHFLNALCSNIQDSSSFLSRATIRANASYTAQPPPPSPFGEFTQHQRYTSVSKLFTYALVTRTAKADAEIDALPPLLQASRWTFYLDDAKCGEGAEGVCTEKWLGTVARDQAVIANVRPDGYVGNIGRWEGIGDVSRGTSLGRQAAEWLDEYYQKFLMA
ncbi:hypothetical protein VTO42DRAFT_639 [Malbranchea cinnamomea]